MDKYQTEINDIKNALKFISQVSIPSHPSDEHFAEIAREFQESNASSAALVYPLLTWALNVPRSDQKNDINTQSTEELQNHRYQLIMQISGIFAGMGRIGAYAFYNPNVDVDATVANIQQQRDKITREQLDPRQKELTAVEAELKRRGEPFDRSNSTD